MKRNKNQAPPHSIPELERRLRSLLDESREVRKALRMARAIERADNAKAARQEPAHAS